MIIDCHCHAGKGEGLAEHWTTDAPLDPYLRRARAAGITHTVLFAAGHTDYARANAQVARLVARDPHRFIGFACVHATRDAGRVRALVDQAVRRWGFRGLKVHRDEAPITREICEAARVYRLPVLYDVVGAAAPMELVAGQYPDVNFIIPHLGSFLDDYRAHIQVIDLLTRWPNLYADTAGVRRFDYLVQAVERAGAHKLLFGSDGPWLHPALELQKIRLLHLPPADEACVLGQNLHRLLWADRRSTGRRPATGGALDVIAGVRPRSRSRALTP